MTQDLALKCIRLGSFYDVFNYHTFQMGHQDTKAELF